MCTALAAISAGASLFGGYATGQTAQAQAEAQAQAMEANARTARIQAHDSIERGGQDELKLRRQLAQTRGTQRAVMAAQGVDVNSGSALDVQNASIAEGEHDAEVIRFNAARQRWGYINQANNLQAQAAATRSAGMYTARNSLIGGIGGAVTSGLDAFDKWRTAKKSSPLTQ